MTKSTANQILRFFVCLAATLCFLCSGAIAQKYTCKITQGQKHVAIPTVLHFEILSDQTVLITGSIEDFDVGQEYFADLKSTSRKQLAFSWKTAPFDWFQHKPVQGGFENTGHVRSAPIAFQARYFKDKNKLLLRIRPNGDGTDVVVGGKC